MIGIKAWGTAVPRNRLAREMVARAWESRSPGGEKAAINYDEDALTLCVDASQDLVSSQKTALTIDGVFFASTTAPYLQRSCASLLAAVLDASPKTATADFGGSLRCGTIALRHAMQALQREAAANILVASADVRDGEPGSAEEFAFGDAGCAILVGADEVVAELVDSCFRTDDFQDEWRRDFDRYVLGEPSKFTTTRGYQNNLVSVGKELLEARGLSPKDIARVVLPSPDGQAHLGVAKALGFKEAQIQNVYFHEIGVTGAAMPLFLLATALENARPEERILLLGYGDGADAFLFRATGRVAQASRNRIDAQIKNKSLYPSYPIYRKMRDYWREKQEGPELSNVLLAKEEKQNVRLHGTACPRCKLTQYPPAPVCLQCRNQEGVKDVALVRHGNVFTFTCDHLYGAPQSPLVMCVVDLDGGGRLYLQMTDVDPNKVRVGDPVTLTLRRRKEGERQHHYYWKCRPSLRSQQGS